MERITYLLSISAKGILPEGKPSGMDKLEQMFGPVQEVGGFRWYLSGGMDEKVYRATRSETHPLTTQEVEELQAVFGAEKRILEVYRLEKM